MAIRNANKHPEAAKSPVSGKSEKRATRVGKRSADRRTTLRVPKALDAEVARVSEELGVSGNEALIWLAARDAESARRERALREVIERRHAAVLGSAWLNGQAVCTADQGHFALLGEAIAELFSELGRLEVLPAPALASEN